MATWVVGDIHGCYRTFEALLGQINLAPHDTLICVGDLINRGPDSHLVLSRFTYDKQLSVVLGNHDCAYLFWSLAGRQPADPLFDDLAKNPDHDSWVQFLKSAPFIYDHPLAIIVHAGLWPWVSFNQQKAWENQLTSWLQRASEEQFQVMRAAYRESRPFGGPSQEEQLSGIEELRALLEIFTKMRYVDPLKKHIDFRYKGYPLIEQPGLLPWFEAFDRQLFQDSRPIIFGHWSALMGLFEWEGFFGLDTGCVWGGELTAYCLEERRFIKQKKVEPGHVVTG